MSPVSFNHVLTSITEEQRARPEYSAFYYNQRPLDPRLPKPIEPVELAYGFGVRGPRPLVPDTLHLGDSLASLPADAGTGTGAGAGTGVGMGVSVGTDAEGGAGDSDDEAGSLTAVAPSARLRTVVDAVINDAIGSFEEKPHLPRAVSPVNLIQQDFPSTEAVVSPQHSPRAARCAIQRPRPQQVVNVPPSSVSPPLTAAALSASTATSASASASGSTSGDIGERSGSPFVLPPGGFADNIPVFVPRPNIFARPSFDTPPQPTTTPPLGEPFPAWLPSGDVAASTAVTRVHSNSIGSSSSTGSTSVSGTVSSSSNGSSSNHGRQRLGSSATGQAGQAGQTPYTAPAMELLTLQQIIEQLMPMARDQNGSRFIQMKLETSGLAERQVLFEAVAPHVGELMCDIFGNYVVQKFYEIGTEAQKRVLCGALRGAVVAMSKNAYGCRVVQKALESTPEDVQLALCAELAREVLPCVTDQNGNHVIQKCIETLPAPRVQFIVDAFLGCAVDMARHPYGCRVLQRIIEHCAPAQTQRLVAELLVAVDAMLTDPFGNYVIQHIMERGLPAQQAVIVHATHLRVVELSKHKFASNVMEKCVEFSDPALRSRTIIRELLEGPPGQQRIFQLVADQYGNYVVQKMLDVCDPPTRDQILAVLRPHLPYLESLPYGRHILQCMARFDPAVAAFLPASPLRGPARRPPPDTRSRPDRPAHRNNGVSRYPR